MYIYITFNCYRCQSFLLSVTNKQSLISSKNNFLEYNIIDIRLLGR